MKFHILTVGRNVAPWIAGCLASARQVGQDFDVCVVDDASTDDSAAIGRAICEENGWAHVVNDERKGGLCNQVLAIDILAPAPEDVLVVLDADDRFPHDRVLERLAVEYADPAVGLTYGSYRSEPFSQTCTLPTAYPEHVINERAFRQHGLCWNHLRTWRYAPFAHLDRSRFRYPNGEWLTCAQDYAIMYPLLEMVGANHRFISDVLYLYNSANPNSDWRVRASEIDKAAAYILRDLPKVEPYSWE